MSSFESLPLSSEIKSVLSEIGFTTLTPIQEKTLEPLLQGKDVIGQARTGSGKTLAFSIPILQKIEVRERYPQALILCPTRELATQVAREIRKLARRQAGLQVLIVTGGQSSREQSEALENGVHIVVGTPGRVLDMMERERLYSEAVATVVLDEADKMLEMGFEDEVQGILNNLPSSRQTVLFSATFEEQIQNLAGRYLKEPLHVHIESTAEEAVAIEPLLYDVGNDEKINILARVLQQHTADSILIFCNHKANIAGIVEKLQTEGVSCAPLHGDMEQRDRAQVMSMFRNGSYRVLVATDVAARGLDIEHLDLVINYDLPKHVETYVHRVGRTGRAGRSGVAITLECREDESRVLYEIESHMGQKFVRPRLGFKNQHSLRSTDLQARMRTLWISGGRKDKLRPGDIVGALTGDSGALQAADIGKIEVQDHFSLVAVKQHLAERALQSLRDGRIKKMRFQIRLLNS